MPSIEKSFATPLCLSGEEGYTSNARGLSVPLSDGRWPTKTRTLTLRKELATAPLTRDKHLARNMTYERLPWCPLGLSMASRRSDPSMGPFGLSGISLLYLFGQKLEWHNSRRGCKEFTERHPNRAMGVPDSVWLLQSRQSVARSFVHSPSASPKVEREEDPTVRASAGGGGGTTVALDGRTGDAAVASLMM